MALLDHEKNNSVYPLAARVENKEELLQYVRDNLTGENVEFTTPYGTRKGGIVDVLLKTATEIYLRMLLQLSTVTTRHQEGRTMRLLEFDVIYTGT